MSWIHEHLRHTSEKSADQPGRESQFAVAARARWLELGEELRRDVTGFKQQGSEADMETEGEERYRVRNHSSGLELTLTADFDNQNVRYDYSALNQSSAGVPEGGMLSMRQSSRGEVEFYSADERLTSEETRQVLLEPLSFLKRQTP